MPSDESTGAPIFRVPGDQPTIAAALAAAAPVQGTVVVAAGTYKEAGTLKVAPGVSLEGSGCSTIIESASATVVACADGAVRVAHLSILQSAADAVEPCFGVEVRGKTLIDECRVSARCRAKNACGVLARGAAAAPTLRGCIVHECGHAGVLLASGARTPPGGQLCA